MLFSVEQAFVGREEIRAPLKTPAWEAIHILNTVDVPHLVASEDYTNWIVAKDLTHKALYYGTYNDLTVRVIYLNKVQPQGKMLKLSLSTPVMGFKDTTDELETVDVGHTEL